MNETPLFVARTHELARLDSFLDKALANQGQVCFVTGEAGSGKTALLTEFTRRAQNQHKGLVTAMGICDAQTGAGNAYLPFREILNLLTGDVDAKLAQGKINDENADRLRKLLVLSGEALVEFGPALINLFVPGTLLIARASKFLAKKAGWADKLQERFGHKETPELSRLGGINQEQIYEQYINVLNALAKSTPLMLVLDDLQWADSASTGLLFRLVRRLESSPIFIVGTYRPNDVALGRDGLRHPLESVLSEIKRYYGNIVVDLDQARTERGRQFVDTLLDTESNNLSESFHEGLFQHTGGLPLFTIELLRDMQERGDLVLDDDGRWVEGSTLAWNELPSRVEGVIEERIGRLADDLRECMTVASVEGEQFTAEVVAQVRSVAVRDLVHQLSGELQKQHRLVESQGVERLSGGRISRYRFGHNLMQTYLYNSLDEIEAAYLHEDVGKALEALYGNQADEIAVQLARHFELAEIPEKARHYLQIAGEQVAAVYANEQGISYFSRALNLTPDSEHEARYALLSAREKLYDLLGDRESQRADLDILEGLADSSGGPEWQAEVAARVANYAVDTSDYPQAITAAEKAVALAQEAGISTIVVDAYNLWSGALWMRGEYEAARFPAERSLALAREISDLRGESQALNHLGVITWKQGDISAAKSYLKQKLSITRQIGDRPEEARSLNNLGAIAGRQGDFPEARSYFEQCLDISREIGHQTAVAYAMGNLGEINSGLGDYAAARPYLEQALGLTRESGERRMESTVLLRLAELAAELQDHDAALNYGEQSLSIVREIGDREYEPRVLSFLGYMALEECNHANANASFLQALEIYRSIGRHHMIPGALAGLARVALTVGDTPKGLAHVEEILDFLADGSQLVTEIEPFRVYLICYQVLQAVRDARANTILETAYNLLQEQAEKIPEAEERRMFLEKVSHNRELIATYNETR